MRSKTVSTSASFFELALLGRGGEQVQMGMAASVAGASWVACLPDRKPRVRTCASRAALNFSNCTSVAAAPAEDESDSAIVEALQRRAF